MFKMRLTINEDLLASLRELPERAQQNLRRKLQTELKPDLQADADALLGTPPNSVSEPFVFASRASQIYYLMLIRENPDLVSDKHWRRTGDIPNSWEVRVSDRLRGSLVTVSNVLSQSTGTEPYPARFLYSPFVPGHLATGWPAQAQHARTALQEKIKARVFQYWADAVREALKGQG